jgi:uncharacterized membrane protein
LRGAQGGGGARLKEPSDRLDGFSGAAALFGLGLLVALLPTSAYADLKMCNSTASRVGIAIGYQDAKGWATEGWWNIGAQTCETLIRGAVPSRYLYVHAVDYDRSGEWTGATIMCTADRTFAIRDVKDCPKRGYKASGFYEVDTGDAKEWTIRLGDPDPQGAKTK